MRPRKLDLVGAALAACPQLEPVFWEAPDLSGTIEDVVRWLSPLRGRAPRILEIGCGFGGQTLALHDRLGALVDAVELQPGVADSCRARVARAGLGNSLRVVCGEAWGLFGRDLAGPYDAILAIAAEWPPALVPALRELAARLVPEGVLVIDDDRAWPPPSDWPAFFAEAGLRFVLHRSETRGCRRLAQAWETRFLPRIHAELHACAALGVSERDAILAGLSRLHDCGLILLRRAR